MEATVARPRESRHKRPTTFLIISQVYVPSLDARHVDLNEQLDDVEIRERMARRGTANLSSIAS